MANHLYRCNQCGLVSVYQNCPKDGSHVMRQLSTAESNEYVRIGHDAFKRIPEPTQRAIVGLGGRKTHA